jgi:hypothetical protein
MRLVSWRPITKGSLRGFATVELPVGLKIFDVPIFTGKNGLWASLPSKPQIDRDGRQKVNTNGKAAEFGARDCSHRHRHVQAAARRQRGKGQDR